MDITCPKCRFTRTIPDDKIPDHAVRATCPKCNHKFQFRTLQEDFLLEEEEPTPPPHMAPPANGKVADPRSLLKGSPLREPHEPPRRPLIPWDDGPEETLEPDEEEIDESSSLLRPPPRSGSRPTPTRPDDPLARLMRSTTPPGFPDDEDEDDIPAMLTRGRAPAGQGAPSGPQRATPLLRTDVEQNDPVRDEYVKPVFQPLLQEPEEKEQEGEDIWRKLERLEPAEDPSARPQPSRDWKPEGEAEAEPAVEAPWERLDRHGFFGGLWHTTTRAMFHPGLFFEALPTDKGLGRPLAYYVIITLLGHALMLPWALTTADMLLAQIQSPVASGWLTSLLSPRNQVLQVAVMPVLGTLQIFFLTSILHVSLFIFQGGRRGFEATFRVMAYTAAPKILFLIPFIGPAIAPVWSFITLLVGLKRIHRTSYLQILLALLLPVAAVFILVFAVVYALSGGPA